MKRIFSEFPLAFGVIIFLMLSQAACRNNADANSAPERNEKKEQKPAEKKPEEPAIKEVEKPVYTYTMVKRKDWVKANDSLITDAVKLNLADINRLDLNTLRYADSLMVPNVLTDPRENYLPFPINIAELAEVDKIIFFSYPTQVFAAYENGMLSKTGPTNMGRKNKPTPTGLFFTNWKSKESISTVNDEWKLKWNFNVSNFGGVGFHQYALPGYPASHSCLRLQNDDAEFLYYWADQWKVNDGKITLKGTPVLIFGEYPFGKTKPWRALLTDGAAMRISKEELMALVQPHLQEIKEAQQNRALIISDTTKVTP